MLVIGAICAAAATRRSDRRVGCRPQRRLCQASGRRRQQVHCFPLRFRRGGGVSRDAASARCCALGDFEASAGASLIAYGDGRFAVGRLLRVCRESRAQRLVAAGETVIDVPAKLATRVRVYSTGHGNKTERADAVAIGRAALHSKHLRMVRLDDENVALKLLSDRRHELIASRTQSVCRLHRLIRELIPGGTPWGLTAERAEALVTG